MILFYLLLIIFKNCIKYRLHDTQSPLIKHNVSCNLYFIGYILFIYIYIIGYIYISYFVKNLHFFFVSSKTVGLNGVYILCFCKNRCYDDRTSCKVTRASSERVSFYILQIMILLRKTKHMQYSRDPGPLPISGPQ